jgi:tetratricopeptide (TPR) repeat protein
MRHHGRFVLASMIAVGVACKQPPRDASFDDPAQASQRVREQVTSCAGLTRVLDQLARSRVTARLLSGLVDDAITHASCNDVRAAIRGRAAAHQLARARLDDGNPDAALVHLTARDVAVRYRRAELLDRLGRSSDALRELDGIALDEPAVALQRLVRVSVAARAGKPDEVAALIAGAPLPDQPRLAHRAAEDAPPAQLTALAQAGALELATAAADRLEQLQGPAAALAARERIATLDADNADTWDALARARVAAGHVDEALTAWDRAIAIAPAQPAFYVAPIRALVIAGQPQRAQARASALAQQARAAKDVELLVTASASAAAAGNASLAVALARDARALRSSDGRLAFGVAQRLADAGETKDAADAYAELLVCGTHGRAWHRHEVAGKLLTLAGTSAQAHAIVLAAVHAKRACETVDAADLTQYITGLEQRP